MDVDADAADELIASLVPFPTAATPGRPVRVRLLDGERGPRARAHGSPPSSCRPAARSSWSGNADAFDYETTEIRYHHPTLRTAAEDSAMRSAPAG